ncbi:hypothetical protein K3495_g1004 [Podosphaera aphanis]|nr:hypothetical protein K3495_g1004 [Podosphaera aphanis]
MVHVHAETRSERLFTPPDFGLQLSISARIVVSMGGTPTRGWFTSERRSGADYPIETASASQYESTVNSDATRRGDRATFPKHAELTSRISQEKGKKEGCEAQTPRYNAASLEVGTLHIAMRIVYDRHELDGCAEQGTHAPRCFRTRITMTMPTRFAPRSLAPYAVHGGGDSEAGRGIAAAVTAPTTTNSPPDRDQFPAAHASKTMPGRPIPLCL